jgi:hypothetical protein
MSQIQKIKNLMLLKEVQTQKPVTAPINVEALIMVLQQIYKIKPEYLDNVTDYVDVDFFEKGSRYSFFVRGCALFIAVSNLAASVYASAP